MARIIKGAWMKLDAPIKSKTKKKKPKVKASDPVYQLKVVLHGSKPAIWRRILVRGGTDLELLHIILQEAMGWEDCHLYCFEADKVHYDPPELDNGDEEAESVLDYDLATVAPLPKAKFKYEYDMGDGWLHAITVEKILPADANLKLPFCVAGEGACPPEDCGGLWGYYAMLDILGDPKHPEYDRMKEWVGGDFDPNAFDIEAANQALKPRTVSR